MVLSRRGGWFRYVFFLGSLLMEKIVLFFFFERLRVEDDGVGDERVEKWI